MTDEETDFPSISLQNSFISTLDHLPCDIVRSLWLIQSCNIKIENSKKEINEILSQRYNLTPGSQKLIRLYELKKTIRHLSNESIQETKAMKNQLITHKLNLLQEMEQLTKIEIFRTNNDQIDECARKELREQLKKHYLENPLASQVEAVREQNKENETKTEIESEKENENENADEIQSILEIPQQDKVEKPTDKKVVKKIETKTETKDEINPETKDEAVPKTKKRKYKKSKVISNEDDDSDEDGTLYCFCKQKSFGNMISCDNEDSCINGEWFHYKCVGLLNRVDALKYTTGKIKWYCSDKCKEIAESKSEEKPVKKRRKRRKKWYK